MRSTLLVLFAVAFSSPCLAEWETVAEASSGDVYLVDRGRINVVSPRLARAWVKRDSRATKPAQETAIALLHYEFLCDARRLKLLAATLYKPDGDVRYSSSGRDMERAADDVVPDSVMEAVFDDVCAFAKRKAK